MIPGHVGIIELLDLLILLLLVQGLVELNLSHICTMGSASTEALLPVLAPVGGELNILILIFGVTFAVSLEPGQVGIVELFDLLILLLLGQGLVELDLSDFLAMANRSAHAGLPVLSPHLGVLEFGKLERVVAGIDSIEVEEVIGVGKFITKGEV